MRDVLVVDDDFMVAEIHRRFVEQVDGFRAVGVARSISRRYAMEAIEGRDGLSLFEHWRDGYKTLHGMTSHGFPNQFHTGFIQGGVSANTTAMFEQQAEHIAYIIAEAVKRKATTVEPSVQAQEAWGATIKDVAMDTSAFDRSRRAGTGRGTGRVGHAEPCRVDDGSACLTQRVVRGPGRRRLAARPRRHRDRQPRSALGHGAVACRIARRCRGFRCDRIRVDELCCVRSINTEQLVS